MGCPFFVCGHADSVVLISLRGNFSYFLYTKQMVSYQEHLFTFKPFSNHGLVAC